MTAKRIASYIGLTIFAVCVCITVVMMLRYSELKALTLLILALTALIAGITYATGRYLTQCRLRNPIIYDATERRVMRSLEVWFFIAILIWVEVDLIRGWLAQRTPDVIRVVGCGVLAVFACLKVYSVTAELMKDGGSPPKRKSSKTQKQEATIFLVGCGFLALLVAYILDASIPWVFPNATGATGVLLSKMLGIVGIWALLIVLLVGLSILSRGTDAAKYALPNNLPQVDGHTDSSLHANACWRGTWLAKERVWLLPVPVFGRGYWTRGFGKAWLAEEVLAFKPNNQRLLLAIP